MSKKAHIEALRSVWLFERCGGKELSTLASNVTTVSVPAGKVLAREGDLGREFFVLVSGKVEASRGGVSVRTLGPGSFFGEMALLDRQPRTATVTATEPCELMVLTTQAFVGVIDTMPSVDRKMLTVLAERLREVESRCLPVDERTLGNDF
ncbi:MAG TPA: cyclic nucleotide-binding domain-containing protein [Acidimicrobiia bacterium]|nr:cyclic nucleotide-binding domain-containing protein [Acidimicrobiia bacterium]